MRIVQPVRISEMADLRHTAARIQDAKRAALDGRSSPWPDHLDQDFAVLESAADANPYVRLDLDYLRDRSRANRSFAYVITYQTFIAPPRNASELPSYPPELMSVVKLGDGGREAGRSAGRASGSIICRIVRSYWDEGNAYDPVLHGVTIPGNDSYISRKIADRLGGWDMRLHGDVWHRSLLDSISVDALLELMEP